MSDPTAQLKSATRRAKSDVANKLISMFLHELSRAVAQDWNLRVDSDEYLTLVRQLFENRCPYCNCDLHSTVAVVEHLDGMNRFRIGLHVAGNVLVTCRKCNNEKRRDDSLPALVLAESGWESFLSHDGKCKATCGTCRYWQSVWPVERERTLRLERNVRRIREFRAQFPNLESIRSDIALKLPTLITKLYSDCQDFAEGEIRTLLKTFKESKPAMK